MRLAHCRVERRARIPAAIVVAVGAGPAPVDVEHSSHGIVAVDNKRMPHSHILTAVEHRPTVLYLLDHDGIEGCLCREFGTLAVCDAGVIAEVVGEGSGHTHFICA